jgi:ectoine hydroxylase-related dioxygenase (phytanoyl-CoA dioxygenase family)
MINLEQIQLQYESLGFAHIPGVIPPALVERLKGAFDDAFERHSETWKRHIDAGQADRRYCDIPDILDWDSAFVDIVDLPELVPVLLNVVGPDIQLNHTHARVFPPGKTFTAPWHSDLANVIGIDLGHSTNFFAKVHYFFEDLRSDQGCLAFIPGSHRFDKEFPRPQVSTANGQPLVVKVVPKAGDVVLFNTHLLHMALDNESPLVRKSLIYAYSHFWVKHYANSVPKDLEKYATTPLRRQLFGVEEAGVSYFDQRYDSPIQQSVLNSFGAAGRKLLKRVLRSTSVSWKK